MLQYEDRLSKIYKLNISKSFHNLLSYHFGLNMKEIKLDNNFYNLSSLVNYLDKITYNDDMLDDYYRDRSKQNLANILTKEENISIVNKVIPLCHGLNIDYFIKFKPGEYNPLRLSVNRMIKSLDDLLKQYFNETYNQYLKSQLFCSDKIPYVFIYNYISDSTHMINGFIDNEELYNSPFYIIDFSIQLTDEDERNINYITIPVLVFPFLNKVATIMLSFNNKKIYTDKDYLNVLFSSIEYDNTHVENYINILIQHSINIFLEHNPYYMTNVIDGVFVESINGICFGNIVYDKVCGFLRSDGASRHLVISREKGMYLLDNVADIEDELKHSELYENIRKYEKKNIKDYNEDCNSWIDKFYFEEGMANIDNLYKDINRILNTNIKVEPLVSYIKEPKEQQQEIEED